MNHATPPAENAPREAGGPPPRDEAAALAALFEALAAAPYKHDFFHLLRRIDALSPRSPRLGRALRPALEPVRLGQDPELDFAPAALTSFDASGERPRLGVRFFGLFGPQGALPLHLTEYARERARHHADPGFARFADVFHHRMLSLFYRAWAQAQPTVQHDRPADDRFATWLGALFGLAPRELRDRDAVGDDAKRFQAGLLARGVKNAEGLALILRRQFGVPVRIESFVGHWMVLREQDRTRLGAGHAADPSAQLGRSAVLGSKVWDRQHKFRIHLGPLSFAQYESFLPGAPALVVLRDWVRQYAGLGLAWDLRLVLRGDDLPRLRAGGVAVSSGGNPAGHPSERAAGDAARPRVGMSSWLAARAGEAPRHRADYTFSPEAALQRRAARHTSHLPLETAHA